MSRVFISHSGQDSEFAARLCDDLAMAGHRPWIHDLEVGAGDEIIDRIQEGLRDCPYMIVILSRSAVESKWVDTEWKERLWGEIKTRTLIPVLTEPCDIPMFLRTRRYADFSRSYAVGFAALILKLRSKAVDPRFPVDLIADNYLNAIEHAAHANPEDHIRIACAHTVWSYRPERAIPLLEDALRDYSHAVSSHARFLLDELR